MYRRTNGSLNDALKDSEGGIAALYGHTSFLFAKVEGGKAIGHDGPIEDLSLFHTVRIFGDGWETRWTANQGIVRIDLNDEKRVPENNQYLLWGKVDEVDGDWACVFEPRVSRIWVPYVGAKEEEHLCLKTIEILDEDRYGNLAVVDEIFQKFDKAEVSGKESV